MTPQEEKQLLERMNRQSRVIALIALALAILSLVLKITGNG